MPAKIICVDQALHFQKMFPVVLKVTLNSMVENFMSTIKIYSINSICAI